MNSRRSIYDARLHPPARVQKESHLPLHWRRNGEIVSMISTPAPGFFISFFFPLISAFFESGLVLWLSEFAVRKKKRRHRNKPSVA